MKAGRWTLLAWAASFCAWCAPSASAQSPLTVQAAEAVEGTQAEESASRTVSETGAFMLLFAGTAMTRLCVIFVLAFAVPLYWEHAEAGDLRPFSQEVPHSYSPASSPVIVSGLKSEKTALLYSLLGTTVPIAVGTALALNNGIDDHDAVAGGLVLGGIVVGPSLGHVYAGRYGTAFGGTVLRAVPAMAGAAAVALAYWSWAGEEPDTGLRNTGIALVGLSGLLGIRDIARAPGSARAHNEQTLNPRVSLGAVGPSCAPGLRMSVTF